MQLPGWRCLAGRHWPPAPCLAASSAHGRALSTGGRGEGEEEGASRRGPGAPPQHPPTPVAIKLLKAEKRLNLQFDDGCRFSLPAELLRVCSPSADNQRPGRVVAGRRHVGIMGVQPVGRYAIRIEFDDLHRSGLYTWDLLYGLGTSKLSRARSYLKQLKAHGLSRDPPKARPVAAKRSL